MSIFGTWTGAECAVQVTSKVAAAMMPARGGDASWHHEVGVPPDAVRPGLQGANLEPQALAAAFKQLAAAAPRRIGAVTLVLPDACAKLRIVPIEAEQAPSRRAGEEILRWALRDTLPFPADEALVDTQLFDRGSPWRLLVTAAHRDVLRQYEEAASLIAPVVRTLPAILACGWIIDDDDAQHLLVHADDDTLGCMVSAEGTPLFVRVRPLPASAEGIVTGVIETLDYAAERLGAGPGRATVLGLAAGHEGLDAALRARGWSPQGPGQSGVEAGARQGALAGALRAAEMRT